MSKPKPGTWEADNSAMIDVIYLHVDGLADRRIAEFIGPDAAENAAKAAHAVNCYGELLEACKAVQRDIDGFVMGEWESSEEAWNALSNRLQAAIAKAEATA